MNKQKAQAVFACLVILLSLATVIGVAQTPPGSNTLQQGEGGNMPTITAQYGYFYGVPPVNITDQLFGDFGALPVSTTSDVTASGYFLDTDNKTDLFAFPITEASYVIWTDGINYYAKNGTTGQVQFSGADAATVIQDSMDALDTSGVSGSIFIKAGTYYISKTIVLPDGLSGLSIIGEGCHDLGTNLRLMDNVNDDMFEYSGAQTALFIRFMHLHLYGNKVAQTAGSGIKINALTGDGLIFDCFIERFKQYCIIFDSAWNWRIYGNTIEYADLYGLYLPDKDPKVIGNKFLYNVGGILINGGHPIVVDNFFYLNTGYSIRTQQIDGAIISNNMFYKGGASGDIYLTDNSRRSIITENTMDGQSSIGVAIIITGATTADNVIKDNTFTGYVTFPVSDAGGQNVYNTVILPFIQGTTFLSTAPFGWEIDLDTEYAIALGALPQGVNQPIKWKIYATGLVAETDKMRLEINGYAGADNEVYTTETVAVADKPSASSNFAVNDVIYWLLTQADDTDLDDMRGGDQIMIQVRHEAAGGDDCATDAVFTYIIIEYV